MVPRRTSSAAPAAEELTGLADWIRALLSDQIRSSDIGVLCAQRSAVKRVEEALCTAGVENVVLQSGANGRSVPGVWRAKGLGFYAVAMPFLSDTSFPPQGALNAALDPANREDMVILYRSLLHIAATRAKKALRVSWFSAPTKLMTSQVHAAKNTGQLKRRRA